MTWRTFQISDKRYCDNCHTRRSPVGGEWVASHDGLRRTWQCGVCAAKRRDAYEATDKSGWVCELA